MRYNLRMYLLELREFYINKKGNHYFSYALINAEAIYLDYISIMFNHHSHLSSGQEAVESSEMRYK